MERCCRGPCAQLNNKQTTIAAIRRPQNDFLHCEKHPAGSIMARVATHVGMGTYFPHGFVLRYSPAVSGLPVDSRRPQTTRKCSWVSVPSARPSMLFVQARDRKMNTALHSNAGSKRMRMRSRPRTVHRRTTQAR